LRLYDSPSPSFDAMLPHETFEMVFLVVDQLAYDMVLGHDFMAHFSLHPVYAARPFTIVGRPSTRSAPLLHPTTSSIVGGGIPVRGSLSPGKDQVPPVVRDEAIEDKRSSHTPSTTSSRDEIFQPVPRQAQLIDFKIKGLDVVFGKSVIGALKPNYPKFSTITSTGTEDVDVWPGPEVQADALLDDDLAMTLDYAVPDFHDEDVTLPLFDVTKPEAGPYRRLCENYRDLFVNRPGHCDLIEHSIP
ncbi:hypothetical protein FOL47_004645, partial [Perkinsus chesapeaki]